MKNVQICFKDVRRFDIGFSDKIMQNLIFFWIFYFMKVYDELY